MPQSCDRCKATNVSSTIMSRFNTQIICPPCEDRERAHPGYADAEAAELRAVKNGDYNFPGIGLPADLQT